MKIYIAHSKAFDYKNELYLPIRNDVKLNQSEIILPHEEFQHSHGRDFYKDLDLFIAEVSYPAFGVGIELGWAYDDNVPIAFLCKRGVRIGTSLTLMSNDVSMYSSNEGLQRRVEDIILRYKK